MTFVPPNPHLTLRALQEILADLRQLALLSTETETSAYAKAAAHVQAAIETLEREATPPAP
jgi:hypothetical protein